MSAKSLRDAVQGADLNLPGRVIVDQHGHYWRDYGEFLSMCPVSDENTETEVVHVYTLTGDERLREAARAVVASSEPDIAYEGEGFVDYIVPFDAIDALRAALTDPKP